MYSTYQVEFLMSRLQDPDPKVRSMIAVELGHRADKQAVPALISLLDSEDNRQVRHAAIQALGAMGDHRASEVLTECLLEADSEIRVAARQALFGLNY